MPLACAAQIRAALTAAGAADDASAAALSALQPPQVSPAPQPVQMGLTGGQWGPLALPACPTISAIPGDDDEDWWDGRDELHKKWPEEQQGSMQRVVEEHAGNLSADGVPKAMGLQTSREFLAEIAQGLKDED